MSTEYVGKMLDGQMHGHGKLIYENNEYYEGDFVRGKCSLTREGSRSREMVLIFTIILQENVKDRVIMCTLIHRLSKV